MQPLDRHKILKQNLLRRLYGSDDSNEKNLEKEDEIQTKNEKRNNDGVSNRSTLKKTNKVYTVSLPPEGFQINTTTNLEPEVEASNTSSSDADEKCSAPKRRRKRKRKHKDTYKEEKAINNTDCESQATIGLTKNQKRKLKKKKSMEKKGRPVSQSFVYSVPTADLLNQTHEDKRVVEKMDYEKVRSNLLAFIDGIWDVKLAEGRLKDDNMENESHFKTMLDNYIKEDDNEEFGVIKCMCDIQAASMLRDKYSVTKQIKNIKSLPSKSSDIMEFFVNLIDYWLEQIS